MTLLFFAAEVLCFIRTVFFGIFTARNKNASGAVLVFVLAAAVAAAAAVEAAGVDLSGEVW